MEILCGHQYGCDMIVEMPNNGTQTFCRFMMSISIFGHDLAGQQPDASPHLYSKKRCTAQGS